MKVKSLFASLVVSVLVFSFSFSAFAFTDVSNSHLNYLAITFLEGTGVVEGYSDGSYGPDNSVNRAEFLKILLETRLPDFDYGDSYKDCFPDVADEWFAKYVCQAEDNYIIAGYPDGFFRPEGKINLVEALKIVLGAYAIDTRDSIGSQWYSQYYETAELNGWLQSVDPTIDHFVSRGEMAQLIYNIESTPVLPIDEPPYESPSSDWEVFINWMHYEGYDSQFIDYYEAKYVDSDAQYADVLDSYLAMRTQTVDDGEFFSLFKNSNKEDIVTLRVIEIYPTEPGWLMERNSEHWEEVSPGFWEDRELTLGFSIGRTVNIEVEKQYISYDDYFFSDDTLYSVDSESKTFYTDGVTFGPYAVHDEWTEIQTDGKISLLADSAKWSGDLFLNSNSEPLAPGAAYVFMGGVSPDNYAFEGVELWGLETGCVGLKSQSYMACGGISTARTSFLHELGHVLYLPHATVYGDSDRPLGLPTTMFGSHDDWPCVAWGPAWDSTYSPIERYAIEPDSGFEDSAAFAADYNLDILCE